MNDRIYLPVRCPGCHKISVTSLPLAAAETAVRRGQLPLSCAFDCCEWTAAPTDCGRLQRLIDEHAIVANLPWFKLRARPASHAVT